MADLTYQINSEDIRFHLSKILQSEKFLSSERFTRFTEYVVNETLTGNSDKIKAYSIAVAVFDRDSHFDPQTDPIVRIYAGRLRQALQDYYHAEGKNDTIKITIPKGTYVPVFSKNKLPRNNWFQSKLTSRYFKLAIVAITGLIILAYITVNSSNKEVNNDVLGRTSIAINTFQNLSSLTENEQLPLRLLEQIEIALGQFSSVVIENSLKGKASNYNMSGSVQQEMDVLKITVKLVDNKTGIQVFSKEYKESLNTNAAVYNESVFANKIAIDLADEFGELQKFRLRSAQNSNSELLPHESVLLYYDYLANLNKSDNELVLKKLQITVENNTRYAPAWAAISGLYMDRYLHFGGDEKDLEFAKSAVEKAENINPRSSHVQKHLAFLNYTTGNIEGFYEAAEKQMLLNPNSTMLGQTGLWYCLIGDFGKGVILIENAQKRNPYYPRYLHFGTFFYHFERGELDKALIESEKVRLPYLFWDPLLRISALSHLGRKEEALIVLDELLELKPNFKNEGLELIHRGLYLKKHKAIVIEGLDKIGFKIN